MNWRTLQLKQSPRSRIDLSGIVPDRIETATSDDMARLTIMADDVPARLGDWFDIEAGGQDGLRLVGDLSRVDAIGGGMRNGEILVEGNVGDRCGAQMHGGNLTVYGNAGRFTASRLRAGQIVVHGDCGDWAAAALPTESRGMRGGKLVIHGDCGQWLGARMRRGTVFASRNVGAGCAARMIAGTIVIGGEPTLPLGAMMRRGTILLLSQELSDEDLPGFTPAEMTELSCLPLLMESLFFELDGLGYSERNTDWHTVKRSIGDRTEGGYGEILTAMLDRY